MQVLSVSEKKIRFSLIGFTRVFLSLEFMIDVAPDAASASSKVDMTVFWRGSFVNVMFPFVAPLVQNAQETFLEDLAAAAASSKK